MIAFLQAHWGTIVAFVVALLADVTILFPSLANNSIYKLINGLFNMLKGNSAPPAQPPAGPTPPAA